MSPLSSGRSRTQTAGTRRPVAVPVPTRPRATRPASGLGRGWHPSMGPRPA
jgi:hypothetical protein